MQYTVILNNRSFDLPPKTIKVAEEIESVKTIVDNKNLSARDSAREIYNFVKKYVPDYLQTTLEESDINDLKLSFFKIIDAYEKPEEDYKLEQAVKRLESLPADKLNALAESVNKISTLSTK